MPYDFKDESKEIAEGLDMRVSARAVVANVLIGQLEPMMVWCAMCPGGLDLFMPNKDRCIR